MAAIAWLVIPVVSAGAAAIWAGWATRDKTQGDNAELQGYEKFREAMERTHSGSHSRSGAA
ncbi:hypothetical protein SRB5_37320 [Streptomyces sp. RB5]|uniref:Uncharacterized protein n=1 Tax=Streptomyces smaragdinus TaxID=2585196 RepID=A0A7K0CLF8_9ACTN|nr:hypothetical protein [Streptomyces smaragdinus]MQY13584.1 hypothetical protein [Streptomyces smaragdinus]